MSSWSAALIISRELCFQTAVCVGLPTVKNSTQHAYQRGALELACMLHGKGGSARSPPERPLSAPPALVSRAGAAGEIPATEKVMQPKFSCTIFRGLLACRDRPFKNTCRLVPQSSAPVVLEDLWRLFDAQPLGLRVETVDSDGHQHAHARKEEEQAPPHRAQH